MRKWGPFGPRKSADSLHFLTKRVRPFGHPRPFPAISGNFKTRSRGQPATRRRGWCDGRNEEDEWHPSAGAFRNSDRRSGSDTAFLDRIWTSIFDPFWPEITRGNKSPLTQPLLWRGGFGVDFRQTSLRKTSLCGLFPCPPTRENKSPLTCGSLRAGAPICVCIFGSRGVNPSYFK